MKIWIKLTHGYYHESNTWRDVGVVYIDASKVYSIEERDAISCRVYLGELKYTVRDTAENILKQIMLTTGEENDR